MIANEVLKLSYILAFISLQARKDSKTLPLSDLLFELLD